MRLKKIKYFLISVFSRHKCPVCNKGMEKLSLEGLFHGRKTRINKMSKVRLQLCDKCGIVIYRHDFECQKCKKENEPRTKKI